MRLQDQEKALHVNFFNSRKRNGAGLPSGKRDGG
jgi:hypothetical protein